MPKLIEPIVAGEGIAFGSRALNRRLIASTKPGAREQAGRVLIYSLGSRRACPTGHAYAGSKPSRLAVPADSGSRAYRGFGFDVELLYLG